MRKVKGVDTLTTLYTDSEFQAAITLRRAGMANPARLMRLIRDSITFLGLDLSGLTVLTEAASGPYVVTPIIAALAGAEQVLALTCDSPYASVEAVMAQTRALETLSGLEIGTEFHTERSPDLFAQADIVTNLGFVRPIDAEAVAAMKPTAVVPLMCETWEFRQGDVDLEACIARGIAVLGTKEDDPDLEVFAYCGWLCMKMLFDAQIEVHKSKILVVSGDKFGVVIEKQLSRSGALTRVIPNLAGITEQELSDTDAIVVADYTREDVIIGRNGDVTVPDLARMAPSVAIVQFAGRLEADSLLECGLQVYPGSVLEARRMAMTLGGLGPRPVIELHAAGLKVGQALADARLSKKLGLHEAVEYALGHSPAQALRR
jgi:hypothetical protein